MKKFIISEEEKSRILGMHHNAIRKEFISEQLAGAGEPEDLGLTATPQTPTTPEPNLQAGAAIGGTATTPNTQAGASVGGKATDKVGETLLANDKDYNYKKVGDKYYFKLKPNPATPKLQALVKQGKFTDWTLATQQKAVDAISKLNFKSENLETKPLTAMKVDSSVTTGTTTQTPGAVVGGGGKPLAQLAGTPTPDLLKQFPKLGTLDQATQTKITTWTKSPAGQYILNTPVDQREKAMDNLDKMFGGDPLTKELKKPIRQALGMSADTFFGKVGSAIKGGVEGVKQGFQQQK